MLLCIRTYVRTKNDLGSVVNCTSVIGTPSDERQMGSGGAVSVKALLLLLFCAALQCSPGAYGMATNETCSTASNATCIAGQDTLLVLECPNATDHWSSLAWTKSGVLSNGRFETMADCSPHHATCVVNPSGELQFDHSGHYCCEQNHTTTCLELRVNAPPFLVAPKDGYLLCELPTRSVCKQHEKFLTIPKQTMIEFTVAAFSFEAFDITWEQDGKKLSCGSDTDPCFITNGTFNGTYLQQMMTVVNTSQYLPDVNYKFNATMKNEFGINTTIIWLSAICEFSSGHPTGNKTVELMQVKRDSNALFSCPIDTSRSDSTLFVGVSYNYYLNSTSRQSVNAICRPGSYDSDDGCKYGNFSSPPYEWSAKKTRKPKDNMTHCDYVTLTTLNLLIDSNVSSQFTITCFWLNNTEFVFFKTYNVTVVPEDDWVGKHWYAVVSPIGLLAILILVFVSMALGARAYRRRRRIDAVSIPGLVITGPEEERPLIPLNHAQDDVPQVTYGVFGTTVINSATPSPSIRDLNSSESSDDFLPRTPSPSTSSEDADAAGGEQRTEKRVHRAINLATV